MNLFVSAMLMLVLGDNLVLLYLGWEGVDCALFANGFGIPIRQMAMPPGRPLWLLEWGTRRWRSGCSCCSLSWEP